MNELTRCKNPPDDNQRLRDRETRLDSRITVLELIMFRYVRISGIDNRRKALRNLKPAKDRHKNTMKQKTFIMITHLCNLYPLAPFFYIVKRYKFFLIFLP